MTYSRRAIKDLAGLPPVDRDRVVRRLNGYTATPDSPRHDVIHLVGTDHHRLRVGDWRVVFRIEGERIDVLRVGHRREIYR